MEEYEVKYVNIDPEEIEHKVLTLGGKKVFDRLYHRAVFDYPDLRLDKQKAWVRVRDEGDKVMLGFKQRIGVPDQDNSANDGGMIEEEVEVSDFETTCAILRRIGLTDKFFLENRRVRYLLDGVEIDVDYWPQLEPYLEIEGKSWGEVDATIVKLELDPADKKIFSTTQIYKLAGINDKDYSRVTFAEMVKKGDSISKAP